MRLAWRYEYPAGRRLWVTDATFCYRRRFWEGAPFPDTNFGIDTSYLWQGPSKRWGRYPTRRSTWRWSTRATPAERAFTTPAWGRRTRVDFYSYPLSAYGLVHGV